MTSGIVPGSLVDTLLKINARVSSMMDNQKRRIPEEARLLEYDVKQLRTAMGDVESDTIIAAVPMRLVCESCGQLHIDEGEFATKLHHTHSCQHCGLTWRPAVVYTVGVRFLPGFKNEKEVSHHD